MPSTARTHTLSRFLKNTLSLGKEVRADRNIDSHLLPLSLRARVKSEGCCDAAGPHPNPLPRGEGEKSGKEMRLSARLQRIALLLAAVLVASAASAQNLPNPRERVDFWRTNYTELTPEADARAREAQQVFARVVRIAGRRHGVEPQLLIVREDPANVSLPIAIPDGWVVLSRKVLDICYRDPARGRDRLAFVLAHEVSHLLEDDFWHIKFFQALDTLRIGTDSQKIRNEVRTIAQQSNKVLAKELRADEMGIIYLAMAGYDASAIAGSGTTDSFFEEWIAAIDPARVNTGAVSATHPSAAQRATAVRARLQQVSEQAGLFSLGLLLYQSSDFERAIQAFTEFRRYFPGREVHHNLASAHHQMALRHWRPTALHNDQPPMRLSIAVDPLSRASGSTHRSPTNASALFERHLTAAIDNYQLAIAQDPAYLPAHRNLGAAYVLRGESYKAIAILQDALKLAPRDVSVLNNLGVAFYHAGNMEQARHHLARAEEADSRHDATLYNLALLDYAQGLPDAARNKAQAYLRQDTASVWAATLRQRLGMTAPDDAPVAAVRKPESLPDLEVGAYESEIPKTWNRTTSQRYKLGERTLKVARYRNGVMTVADGDEVRLIVAGHGYAGVTARGIRIGSDLDAIQRHYGAPAEVQHATTGDSLLYPAAGVTFNLQQGHVVSWVHYWD